MKDIKQIQQYNRRKIICAVHGTEDYGMALYKEIDINCVIERDEGKSCVIIYEEEETIHFLNHFGCMDCIQEVAFYDYYKIIGKPLTLDRVLFTLKGIKIYGQSAKFLLESSKIVFEEFDEDGCHHVFLEIDWKEGQNLDKQTEETQRAIYKLLRGE